MSPAERIGLVRKAQGLIEELLADMNDGPDDDEYARLKLQKAARALDYVARHWKRLSEESGGDHG